MKINYKIYSILFLFFCILFSFEFGYTQSVFKPGVEKHYLIKSDGKIIGYSLYKVGSKMHLAGEDFVKYRSLSIIRAGIGDITESVFQTDFSVNSKTLKPTYILMQQNVQNTEIVSETVYSDGLIAQKNASGKQGTSYINETEKSCYLFMTNLWGRFDSFIEHYEILLQACKDQKEATFDIYDPILRTEGTVSFIREKQEEIDINGAKKKTYLYTMKDYYGVPLLKIWASCDNLNIFRMKEYGGSISVELSNSSAVQKMKKANGVDLGINKSFISPVYFQDPKSLNMVRMNAEINGRGINTEPYEVLGFSQKFEGESSDLSAKGAFVVKKTDVKIDKPNRFPPFKLDPSLNKYLEQQPGIESKNDFILNKAQEVTWKSRDCRTAAGRLCKWVNENIKSGSALPSALQTFVTNVGNNESKAMLMVALCRAAGIPSRISSGIAFDKGDFVPSSWVEVYIENSGWLPFDVSKGEEGVSPARIRLYEFGDISSIDVSEVDFLPKPAKKVPFHQKDMNWSVGEERTYDITVNDKLIGKERAKVYDMVFGEMGESYLFSSKLLMKVAGVDFNASTNSSFDIKALPLSCELSSGIGNNLKTQKFRFTDKNIEKIISVDSEGNEKKADIPYSKGTYLVDNRFLSFWALVVGQIPRLELGGKYKFTVFLPEDIKTVKVELEVKNFERVEADGKDENAFKCESNIGMIFYISQNSGRVLKISIPNQKLDYTLAKFGTVDNDKEEEPLTIEDPNAESENIEDDSSKDEIDSSIPEDPDKKVEDSDKKVEDSDKKVEDSDKKVEDSDKKVEDSDKKVEDSDKKVEDSDKKVEDSDKKVEDSDKKVEDSDKKVEDSDKKVEDSDKKVKDSDKKVEDSDKKVKDSDKKVEDSDKK